MRDEFIYRRIENGQNNEEFPECLNTNVRLNSAGVFVKSNISGMDRIEAEGFAGRVYNIVKFARILDYMKPDFIDAENLAMPNILISDERPKKVYIKLPWERYKELNELEKSCIESESCEAYDIEHIDKLINSPSEWKSDKFHMSILGCYDKKYDLIVLYYQNIPVDYDEEDFELLIAHELFHALQLHFGKKYRRDPKSKIVLEASADYFAYRYGIDQGYKSAANRLVTSWRRQVIYDTPYSYARFFYMLKSPEDMNKLKEVYVKAKTSISEAYNILTELIGESKRKMSSRFVSDYIKQNLSPEDGNQRSYEFISSSTIGEYIKANSQEKEPAWEIIQRHLNECKEKKTEIYKRSFLTRSVWSDLRNGRGTPSKDSLIAIAIALHLNIEQTEELLLSNEYILSKASKRDLVIRFYIEHGEWNIDHINETLCDLIPGSQLLGSKVYTNANKILE